MFQLLVYVSTTDQKPNIHRLSRHAPNMLHCCLVNCILTLADTMFVQHFPNLLFKTMQTSTFTRFIVNNINDIVEISTNDLTHVSSHKWWSIRDIKQTSQYRVQTWCVVLKKVILDRDYELYWMPISQCKRRLRKYISITVHCQYYVITKTKNIEVCQEGITYNRSQHQHMQGTYRYSWTYTYTGLWCRLVFLFEW